MRNSLDLEPKSGELRCWKLLWLPSAHQTCRYSVINSSSTRYWLTEDGQSADIIRTDLATTNEHSIFPRSGPRHSICRMAKLTAPFVSDAGCTIVNNLVWDNVRGSSLLLELLWIGERLRKQELVIQLATLWGPLNETALVLCDGNQIAASINKGLLALQ